MDDVFKVKGNPFFKKTFYSTVLATNIAVYRYLADLLFEGDIGRIVWASNEKTFRKRQEQLTKRNSVNIGILDLPYCSFRLSQDGFENKAQKRQWFNQALNVEGEWMEELGRKVRITPVQLKYEGAICVHSDTDLYWLQQLLIWDASNEKILKPVLETTGDSGKPQEIANIAVIEIIPHMNSRFSEADWLTNNKIQAIDIDIQIDTFLLLDNRARYWIAKKALLQFANDNLPQINTQSQSTDEIEQTINTEIFN